VLVGLPLVSFTYGFDQGVDRERAAGLFLTVETVAALHEHRFGEQFVSNGATEASTFATH
jgi:hypothetical protein